MHFTNKANKKIVSLWGITKEVPSIFNYAAINEDGSCWMYSQKPNPNEEHGVWQAQGAWEGLPFQATFMPNERWQDTLIQLVDIQFPLLETVE